MITEEWRLGRGAEARQRDAQVPLLFAGSRYAERLPIGSKKVIETASPETIRRFYQDWYRPNLMAVIAVGDVPSSKVEALIKDHFAGIAGPADGARAAELLGARPRQDPVRHLHRSRAHRHLGLGLHQAPAQGAGDGGRLPALAGRGGLPPDAQRPPLRGRPPARPAVPLRRLQLGLAGAQRRGRRAGGGGAAGRGAAGARSAPDRDRARPPPRLHRHRARAHQGATCCAPTSAPTCSARTAPRPPTPPSTRGTSSRTSRSRASRSRSSSPAASSPRSPSRRSTPWPTSTPSRPTG